MSYSVRINLADSTNFTIGRQGKSIDKIIIHHAATTDFDGIGRTFKNPARNASAHYGVGRSNNVDKYVDERNTAWHAGNWNTNLTSIGIENVNKTGAPDWLIDDATFDTLVELVRDIAKRHNLLPLRVGKNLLGHKDVSDLATACPYALEPRLQELADKVNKDAPKPAPKQPDQVLHIGEKFQFKQTYRVDDMRQVNGIWQVRTHLLCPSDFTWNDNGIPVAPLKEVGGGAGRVDQVLQVGSKYTIPGTYTVLNLAHYKGMWIAQISMGGWKLWVDIKTVTEV